jgi:hypothetical protein
MIIDINLNGMEIVNTSYIMLESAQWQFEVYRLFSIYLDYFESEIQI